MNKQMQNNAWNNLNISYKQDIQEKYKQYKNNTHICKDIANVYIEVFEYCFGINNLNSVIYKQTNNFPHFKSQI